MSEELEILEEADYELQLSTVTKEYEEIVDIQNQEDADLAELIKEEREITALLHANRAKQRDIERKRYDRRADLREKEREKNQAESKLHEARRVRQHEEAKAEAFINMVKEAREADYAWVEFAKPHQWEGAMTIAHYGSTILGDGTGTGKTLTAIMSMDMAKHRRVLVITPADIVSSFAEDMVFFAPHRNALPLEGANPSYRRTVKQVLAMSSEYTVITNYESLWRESKWLGDFEWDAIYIDEAHSMKNEKGLSYDALSKFDYKNCVPMTATSILNEPGDLWTSLNMIDPVRFADKYNFLNVFCMQNADGKWVFQPGGEKALMHQLKGRIIKRTMQEVAPDLPKQTVKEIVVPRIAIPQDQAQIMTQLANFAAIQLEDGTGTSIQAIIALITRERQAATYPAGIEVRMTESMYEEMANNGQSPAPVGTVLFSVPKDTSSIKLDMAEEKLERMFKAGRRSVVFSQFKTALVDLEKRLVARGLRVARYDGDTNKANRLAIKRDFLRPASGERKSEFQYDVVLANYKTGGVGLTFTEATYMLCLDEEWNPAKNLQAWARIHRIGQTEETEVDILRVEKSIDMWMKTLNEKKRAIVEGFESEIDMVADLKQYFSSPAIEEAPAMKAIESSSIEIDDDFLALLDGM